MLCMLWQSPVSILSTVRGSRARSPVPRWPPIQAPTCHVFKPIIQGRPMSSCHTYLFLLIAVTAVSSYLCSAALAAPPLSVDKEFVSLGFEESFLWNFLNPTDVQVAPNDDGNTLLVAEKTGQLWVVENVSSSTPIRTTLAIDLASRMCTNGERGLGGVAFHPSYPTMPYIYVHYNFDKYNDCYNGENKRGLNRGPVNRLSRFVLDPNTQKVIESSEKVFLETPRQPVHNHNGGNCAFGRDGLLYVSLGDGGTRVWTDDLGVFYSQALSNLFGTIVRLTDEGEIPQENPFTPSQGHSDSIRCGNTEGEAPNATTKCQEIYSYGLRNPFRFAFDPDSVVDTSSRFFIHDVGRTKWEKIVEGRAGGNYGYPMQDGPCIYNRKVAPDCQANEYTENAVFWYEHDSENGGCITGGAFVSKDYGWPDSFQDSYLFAEYAISGIYVMTKGRNGCDECNPPVPHYDTKILSNNEKIVSMTFGLVADGRSALYYVTRGKNGDRQKTAGLYRIAFTGTSNRSPTARIVADATYGFSPLMVNFDGTLSFDPDGDTLTYEWDFNSDTEIDSTASKASFQYNKAGTYSASLTVKDGSGGTDTTTIRIEVDNIPPTPVIVSPSEGVLFSVGDKFVLEGSAFDAEDGFLDDSALVWEVRQHHKNHWHPFLDPTPGNRIALDGAPEPEDFDAATTSYLEVLLTATDSTGLSTTVSAKIMPKMVELEFDTVPGGLKLTAYGDTVRTPATIVTWDNHAFEVEAPATTVEDGESFSFISWSNGGERIHYYVASSSGSRDSENKSRLTAVFQRSEGQFPSDQFSGKQSHDKGGENETTSSPAPGLLLDTRELLIAAAASIVACWW